MLAHVESAVLVFITILLTACIVIASLKNKSRKSQQGSYRQRKLMTDNEAEFFGRLVVALPDHYVFPQVAMSALLEASSRNSKTAHSDRLRIAQQRVDYVVCNKNCDIVAVVELDDRTHSRTKDQMRDARLKQGSIHTVRFQARAKPSVEVIRTTVLGLPVSAATGPADMAAAAARANAAVVGKSDLPQAQA